MAKNKQMVSVDSLIKLVLVPETEQAYELPSNWIWIKLESVLLELTDGSHFSPKSVDEGFPYITVKDLSEGIINFDNCKMISKEDFEVLSKNNCQPYENDVLFSKDGTVGKTALVNFKKEFVVLSSLAILRPKKNIILPEYLEKVLNSPQVLFQAINSKTGTAIKRVVLKSLCKISIPLPPIAEQQRIVDRIESLFAKLDHAKELIQDARDSFENRKAAILHKAFTGELTQKWRIKKEIEKDDTWHKKRFVDITTKITDGFHSSPKPTTEGYPYIMAGHVKTTGIDYQNGLYMDEKNHRELYNKACPQKGDILLVNIGAGTGTAAIIDVDFEFSFKNCAILKLSEHCYSKFMFYFLIYIKDWVLSEITRGGAQPFLSLKIIQQMEIDLPSFAEQEETARILDIFFEKELQAKAFCDDVIVKIDLIKKAILARVFRGELGTNDPSEESSLELLKQTLNTL